MQDFFLFSHCLLLFRTLQSKIKYLVFSDLPKSVSPTRTHKKGPERGSGPYNLLVPCDGRWCFVMTRVISYLVKLERLLLISQGSNDYFLLGSSRP